MRRTGRLLIALAALLLPGILSAQVVPDTSRHDLLMPYIGAGYARISSGDKLDAALRGSGAATLNGRDAFNSVVAGVSYVKQVEGHCIGISLEYSGTDMRVDNESLMSTELTLHKIGFYITVPFFLSSRWSWSIALGDYGSYASVYAFTGQGRYGQTLDSALAQPAGTARQINARDVGLNAAVAITYAFPISEGTAQTRFLGLHLRVGTDLEAIHDEWSVDDVSVTSGSRVPYRPVFVNLLVSFFTRGKES